MPEAPRPRPALSRESQGGGMKVIIQSSLKHHSVISQSFNHHSVDVFCKMLCLFRSVGGWAPRPR